MKTRRWFQLHLTTLIVLMFSSAGLVGLNATQHDFHFSADLESSWARYGGSRPDQYGWPYICLREKFEESGFDTSIKYLFWNAIWFFGILGLTAIISEILLRHWFHWHRATFIVLLLSFFAFVSLNAFQHSLRFNHQDFSWFKKHMEFHEYGWPVSFLDRKLTLSEGVSASGIKNGKTFSYFLSNAEPTWQFKPLSFFLNVLSALIMFAGIAYLCEKLLRRPKPTPAPENLL